MNIRTLGILLDTLQSDESLLATRPAAPVARAAMAARVARDSAQIELPIAQSGDRVAAPDARASGTSDARPDARPDIRADITAMPRPGTSIGESGSAPLTGSDYSRAPSASLELSATAQWLQKTLVSEPGREPAASIHPSAPLIVAAPGNVHALAQALRESISQSGLFYESHLADWTVQRYPESELRREPQAGWNTEAVQKHESAMTSDAAEGGATGTRPAAGDERGQGSVALLQAQLHALESRQLSWQGELWPGQSASMTIAEEGASPAGELPHPWRTHLTLTLPELGRVDVELLLDGTTLQLALAADAPHSVELLRNARFDLVSALEAQAHTVASLGIRQS